MNAVTAESAASTAWDEAAQGWSRHGELIRAWLNQATEAMLDAAGVKAGDRVLDVAAGAGDQTLDIARRVGASGSVLATDLSPSILRLAETNLRAAGVLNVRVQRADAQALGLDFVNFDAAVCRLGLMFCAEPLLALKGIHRTLVDGARFCALVFSSPETNPCITTQLRVAQRHAGVAAGDPWTPGGLLSLGRPGLMSALMREAGFTAVEVRTLSAPFIVPRCEDYVDFIRSAGSPVIALLKPLPAAVREAAWADIAGQLDRFTTPQGWVGPNELLLCTGVKAARPQESP
jgi:ubiquinone/menaquinone biosynthesis C-methylase UbiE